MVNQQANEALSIVVGMLAERTGLWQVTPLRVALLHQYAHKLSPRSRPHLQEMLSVASRGERFWKTTAEGFIALNEIRSKLRVDKDEIDRLIDDVAACAKRDGVAHREWVKNILDVLARISSEK